MGRITFAAGLVAAALLAAPAHAVDWGESGRGVANRAGVGLNGVITSPVDPVMDTVRPRDEFKEMAGGAVLAYPVGLGQGLMLGILRISTGAFDVLFCWVPDINTTTPVPKYMIIPRAEHPDF